MRKYLFIILFSINSMVFSSPLLYISNSFSHNISVIDTSNNKVISEIECLLPIYRLAIDKDGKYAFVTSASTENRKDISSSLLKVDLLKNIVSKTIPVDISPLANVHLSPDGKLAYIVTAGPAGKRNEIRGKLIVVDLNNNKVTGNILLGLNPLDSVMTKDGKKIFTADWGSRSVTVVDLMKGNVADTIPLGNYPARALAISDDNKQIYLPLEERIFYPSQMMNSQSNIAQIQMSNRQDYNLVVIDTDKMSIKKLQVLNMNRPVATAINHDRLYILNVSGASCKLIEIKLPITDKIQQSETNVPTAVDIAINKYNNNLYLIGTAGNVKDEINIQQQFNSRNNKGNQIVDTMNDLQQLDKTVTLIDPDTGKILKIITVGAMPIDGVVK